MLSEMRVCDAVALTRAAGSARVEVTAGLGGPPMEAQDSRGLGLVDFQADRARMSERMITPRIRARGSQSWFMRVVRSPLFALHNRIVGGDAFYEGGARWTLRRGRWRGPKGAVVAAKSSWHPMFLLDMLDSDVRPLSGGSRELFGGVEVSRHDIEIESEKVRPAVWESWVTSQSEAALRQPRSILWAADDGVLHGFAYEAVLGDDKDTSLWKCTRLWAFGTSTLELSQVGTEIAG